MLSRQVTGSQMCLKLFLHSVERRQWFIPLIFGDSQCGGVTSHDRHRLPSLESVTHRHVRQLHSKHRPIRGRVVLLTTGSSNHVRVFASKLNKVDTDSRSRRKVWMELLVTMLRAAPRRLLRGVCGVSRVRGCASLHPAVPRAPVSGVSAVSGSRTAGIDPATIEHLGQVSPQLLRLVTPRHSSQGWAGLLATLTRSVFRENITRGLRQRERDRKAGGGY